jgi:hypothetical protein
MTQPHLAPVPDEGLFLYPIASADRLDGNSFVKWQHHRWLSSSMHLMASFEVKGMARDLFDLAQTQSPPGTLPQDRVEIARMLRTDPHHFESLCRHTHGPLRGWRPCITDQGELRLYHRTVLEQVQDAFDRRESKALANNAKAVKARRERLVEGLKKAGCIDALLQDEVLIARMDDWLELNWRKRRDALAYDRVLTVAKREGWLGARSQL